jgi:secreted PhoX family phosphatase
MKITRPLTALILALFSFNQVSAQDTLYWSTGYKLTPKDFRGKPDTNAAYPAKTICGIKYIGHASKTSVRTEAFGIFICPKSWAVISTDDSLWLIHEQLYFDIAELYARKLRKTFSEYKFRYATVQQDLDSLYDINHEEMKKMHTSYEEETNYGINASAQSIWNFKIKSELENFEKYGRN